MNRNESKCRQNALRELQIASFSAIETALYLDTHPYDSEAMAALKKYCAERDAAIAKYESEYSPITFCACSTVAEEGNRAYFKWALSPMPWEIADC